jgi:hypothetical protein
VFEDVGDAGGVVGWGPEGDAKDFVFVVIDQRQQFRAGLDVAIDPGMGMQFPDKFLTGQLKTMNNDHGILP